MLGLHAEAELHRGDDGLEGFILGAERGMLAVHRLDEVELAALERGGQVIAGDIRDRGLGHVLAIDPERGARVDGGEESARIDLRFRGVEADEAGQVLVFGAEPVADPRAEAGALAEPVAGVELVEALGVVAGVGVHAVEEAELVGVLRGLGHQLGDPESALAMLGEIEDGTGMLLVSGLRFVIEGVELGGAAAHAEEDDPFRPGREAGELGRKVGRSRDAPFLTKRRKGEVTEAAGGGAEKRAAGEVRVHGWRGPRMERIKRMSHGSGALLRFVSFVPFVVQKTEKPSINITELVRGQERLAGGGPGPFTP